MNHRIDAAYHKASFALGACAWLTIDGQGIEKWLSAHLGFERLELLGLSLMWLLDEEEDRLANQRIVPHEDGTSTIVPLLVCSDDMDFDCTVLVVEQVIKGNTVQWERFGWSLSPGMEVGISTRWEFEAQPVRFDLDEFRAALEKFAELAKTTPAD